MQRQDNGYNPPPVDRVVKPKPTPSPYKHAYRPSWTVFYNTKNNSKWIGIGWEFFDTETDAKLCYDKHVGLGNYPTMRPYYHAYDKQHLNAIHRM